MNRRVHVNLTVPELRLHKHQPAPPIAITASLAGMGHSLEVGCNALANDPSLAQCDKLTHKLRAASQAVNQLRRGLVVGGTDE
jgi:hypothetical protein